ncbi:Hypothetical predicted protein [Lecanosticta acicola]|uniref:Uncharacterized protein n=1 Tax=Lecanosticta acicola TaxID=111012 RepID=A0AAI8Z966_9PEZI|nr:Hypothetical predicted protein [Lecanosticta acicola]
MEAKPLELELEPELKLKPELELELVVVVAVVVVVVGEGVIDVVEELTAEDPGALALDVVDEVEPAEELKLEEVEEVTVPVLELEVDELATGSHMDPPQTPLGLTLAVVDDGINRVAVLAVAAEDVVVEREVELLELLELEEVLDAAGRGM